MKKTLKKPSQHITIYKANQRHDLGFFKTWAVMAKNIANSRMSGLERELIKAKK